MNEQKRIGEFELIDHGIDHSQHFPGCGIFCTSFGNVVTGIGYNMQEAIEDCLEQIAQAEFDADELGLRILQQEGWVVMPITPDVLTAYDDPESIYYHVSIRWNEEK